LAVQKIFFFCSVGAKGQPREQHVFTSDVHQPSSHAFLAIPFTMNLIFYNRLKKLSFNSLILLK